MKQNERLALNMDIIDFSKADWIWGADNVTPDQKLIFRRKINITSVPDKAEAYIACETKFWLWVNGRLAVFEGGVFRESPTGGWAECIDLAPYLKEGENVIALLVWFYGNGGRNNTDSGRAGLIFKCEQLHLYSDKQFTVLTHPAFKKTEPPYPAYLFGEYNIGFDAASDIGDFTAADFNDKLFKPATVYQNTVWGEQSLSPLPQLKLFERQECEYIKTDTGAIAGLPYAMTLSVGFEVSAQGGEVIDVRTDRYTVNGGPGDEGSYNGHRIEYTAKAGGKSIFLPHVSVRRKNNYYLSGIGKA